MNFLIDKRALLCYKFNVSVISRNDDEFESMRDNETAKKEVIRAFFDDAKERAEYLLVLNAKKRANEASTLCLVYIDSFSQWLFWPRSQVGQNFVEALLKYSGDLEFALVHPLFLIRAWAAMKDHTWKTFATRLKTLFPGPKYSLFSQDEFLTHISQSFNPNDIKLLKDKLWKGFIANVVYKHLRNPSIHSFRGAAEVSFDATMYQNQPVQSITFSRLHDALMKLIDEARKRSLANNQWFGNDSIVKGA